MDEGIQLHHRPNGPDIIAEIQHHRLPASIVPLIDAYERTMGVRNRFLWKWAHHLFPKFTLSCVDPTYTEIVRDVKLRALLYVSVLDDLIDLLGDRSTYEEAAKLPFDHQVPRPQRPGVTRDVLDFATQVWGDIASTLRDAPCAGALADMFRFDVTQVLNGIEYAWVANQDLDVLNEAELTTYDAHNMMIFVFADIDLMYSPSFERSDLSTLRRIVARAQRMARIGNWISTWEREVREGDFASGIVAYALEHGVISRGELARHPERVVRRIRASDVEDVFLARWQDEHAAIDAGVGATASVDIGSYLDGIEAIMEYHLASRGLK